jgi:C1A family cysteine protease
VKLETLSIVSLLLGACAASEAPATPPDALPPLGKTAEVFGNAPPNASIPTAGKADAIYPAKFDLMSVQSPVKDQDRRGVCTIFTTTGLMENLYLVAGMASPSFSEQYLQWSVKAQYGSSPDGEGSNIEDNIDAINAYGIPLESVDPYNGKEWTTADDPDCNPDGSETQSLPMKCWTQGDPTADMKAAQMYTLPPGQWLNTSDIKYHMTSAKTDVAVSIPIYYQAWNYPHKLPTNWTDYYAGIIRYPNQADIDDSNTDPAGHGILIVGWDDDYQVQAVDKDDKPVVDAKGKPVMEKGFYIFKNSWGTTSFGKTNPMGAGYGYIPQRYINDFASAYVTDVPDLTGIN